MGSMGRGAMRELISHTHTELLRVSPCWIDGSLSKRCRMGVLVFLALLPSVACLGTLTLANIGDFIFRQQWYGPFIPAFGLLSLLTSLIGGVFLAQQHFDKIHLGEELTIRGLLGRCRRKLSPAECSGYRRTPWGGREKKIIRSTVAIGCGMALLGWLLGMSCVFLQLWGIQFGVKEKEVVGYLVSTVVDFFALLFIPMSTMLLPLLNLKLSNCDGSIVIVDPRHQHWIQRILGGPGVIHVMASHDELAKLEGWLKLAKIPRIETTKSINQE